MSRDFVSTGKRQVFFGESNVAMQVFELMKIIYSMNEVSSIMCERASVRKSLKKSEII